MSPFFMRILEGWLSHRGSEYGSQLDTSVVDGSDIFGFSAIVVKDEVKVVGDSACEVE